MNDKQTERISYHGKSDTSRFPTRRSPLECLASETILVLYRAPYKRHMLDYRNKLGNLIIQRWTALRVGVTHAHVLCSIEREIEKTDYEQQPNYTGREEY